MKPLTTRISVVTTEKDVLGRVPAAITSLLSDIAVKYKVSVRITEQSQVPTFFSTNVEE